MKYSIGIFILAVFALAAHAEFFNYTAYFDWQNNVQNSYTNDSYVAGHVVYIQPNAAAAVWCNPAGGEYYWGDNPAACTGYTTKDTNNKVIKLYSSGSGTPGINWTSHGNGTIQINASLTAGATATLTARIFYSSNSTTVSLQTISAGQKLSIGNLKVNNTDVVMFYASSNGYATTSDLGIRGNVTPYYYYRAANEMTAAPLTANFSLTESNGTSMDWIRNASFSLNPYTISNGIFTITARNETCQTGNVLPRQLQGLNAPYVNGGNKTFYLICDGATVATQTILTTDANTGGAISQALIVISKTVGGSTVNISETNTDSVGSTQVYLQSGDSYTLTISKSGYTTTYVNLTASSSTITIPIPRSAVGGGYSDILNYFTWGIIPDGTLPYPIFTVNATVNASSSGLATCSLNLTLANGTQLYYSVVAPCTNNNLFSSGEINRTNWNYTSINAILTAEKDGFNNFTFVKSYYFSNYSDSNGTLTGLVNALKNSGMPNDLRFGIAFFAAASLAIFTAPIAGTAGGGMIFVIALGIISTIFGYVDTGLIYFLAFAAAGVYVLSRFGV